FLFDGLGEHPVRLDEHAAVLGDAGADRLAPARRGSHVLGGGECAGVLLQSFDAEQLCCDRLLVIPFGVVVEPSAPR
ncbi:MAG TPA: hypothetical protein VFE69_01765, partial [Ilumatobacteraceae bacterium]|nr:hypothetical protein [Ilumatobacteraceae bacterium]